VKQEHGEADLSKYFVGNQMGSHRGVNCLEIRRSLFNERLLFDRNRLNTAAPWLMKTGGMSEITYKLKGFASTLTPALRCIGAFEIFYFYLVFSQ
jgi:hypothetical protein